MAPDVPALALVLIFLLAGAYLARRVALRLRLPPILGELTFGVLLGPGVLGVLSPAVRSWMFSAGTHDGLAWASRAGLIVFMFLVGLELRPSERDRLGSAWVALGGLLLPFLLGLALGIYRPQWFSTASADLRPAFFVAICMTVTALPLLGRILQDVGLLAHPVGSVSLGAALWDDIAAWSLLALLAGGANAGLTGNLAANLALVGVAMLALVGLVQALPDWREPIHASGKAAALTLLALAGAAAWLTHAASLHLFIGPLLVGLATARRPMVAHWLRTRIGRPTQLFLVPVFFIMAGARLDPRLLWGAGAWALVVVVAVATASKTLGCYLGGRTIGMNHRPALAIGLLMNARGAVGILIAEVGLETGLLSPLGFTLLVAAAFVTTLGTPLLFQAYMGRLARASPAAQTA